MEPKIQRADSNEEKIAGNRTPSQAQLPCELLRAVVWEHKGEHSSEDQVSARSSPNQEQVPFK
jgi:hypothetical protein